MTATAALPLLEETIRARYEGAEVEKGTLVRVFKGRKVPVGTIGRVFWFGAGTYGYRVGLNDQDTGDTHWIALDNVTAIVDDKDESETWTEYDARKRAAAEAAAARQVNQWDLVVLINEPEFAGKVFWLSGDRCGVAREGARRVRNAQGQLRNKAEDTRWVNTDQVCQRHLYVPEPELAEEPETESFEDDDLGCF